MTTLIIPEWFLWLIAGAVWMNIILDMVTRYYQWRLAKQQPKQQAHGEGDE